MNASTIIRDTALSKRLKTIPVDKLELGMIVHAIAEQAGSLGVKNKGKVNHLRIIEQLSASGVKSVVVETPVAKLTSANKSIHALNRRKQALVNAKVAKKTESTFDEIKEDDESVAGLTLEFAQASKLLKRSDQIFKDFSEKIKKDIKIDLSESKSVVRGIYESLIANPDALLCLSMIMDATEYQANHAVHAATLACHFGNFLGLSRQECERLALVGYLYDIGMLKVDKRILEKTERLSYKEQLEIQKHVAYSLKLVSPLDLDRESMLAIEQHHERLDGSGYPNADEGSKIHKFSRIISIIDCYDALTSNRPHKKPLSPAAAMKVLSNPDYGYDQKLVLQFIKCMGIFPVGSLVVLSNKHIALVTKTNRRAPTAPEVKIFYKIEGGHFISPIYANLATQTLENGKNLNKNLKVIKPVLASEYGLNMHQIV